VLQQSTLIAFYHKEERSKIHEAVSRSLKSLSLAGHVIEDIASFSLLYNWLSSYQADVNDRDMKTNHSSEASEGHLIIEKETVRS